MTSASNEHVHYLGCMSPGFVCMIQCMEYVPTGDIYIVWEGCGFTGGDWRDASGEHECDYCFDDTCGEGEGWMYWILVIAIGMLAVAAFLTLASLIVFGVYYVYQYYQHQKGSTYSPMVASYPPAEELREMSTPPRVNAQGQALVPVMRREDGMIVISMADGSTRVVTPQMYQKLYHRQQVKRAQMMQQRRIQQQQKRRQDNQGAQSQASPSTSPELSETSFGEVGASTPPTTD